MKTTTWMVATVSGVLAGAVSGCGVSHPQATSIKTPATQLVQAESLQGDLQELLDRAFARDDVIMGEAGKAQGPADQARLTKQAYFEAYGAVNRVQERAASLNLNPFEAKKKKVVLAEVEGSIWKLRYLEKEGSAKAGSDETRLALYERLHGEAVSSLNRVQNILKSRS
jgi:hypothetical protein